VIDISIPPEPHATKWTANNHGLRLAQQIKALRPEIGIVFAYEYHLDGVWDMIRSGQRGLAYKLKGRRSSALIDAIGLVLEGKVEIDPEVRAQRPTLMEELYRLLDPEERPWVERVLTRFALLTPQEQRTANLLAASHNTQGIAAKLGVQRADALIGRVYAKLGLTVRQTWADRALERGASPPPERRPGQGVHDPRLRGWGGAVMRSVRWRDSLAWGLATTLLLGLLATFRLALDIGHPFGGFIEEYLPSAGDRLQIDSNTPPAWPNMAAYDLLSDGLVALNGEPYALNGEPYRPNQAAHYAEAFSRPERTIVLTIERAGELMELSLPIRVFSLTDYLDIKFPIIVTNISLWLLAAIVYSGQPSDPLNRAAAWLFNILALALWTPFVSVFWNDEPLVWLINAATNFAWPMLGAAIINFAWHFPRPLARGPRWLPDLAQALGLTLGVLWAGCRLWIYVFGWSPAIAELDGWAFRASLSGLLVVGLVFFVGRLVWSWRVERDRAVVRGLGIVTIGLVLASPPILLFLIDILAVPDRHDGEPDGDHPRRA